MTPLDMTGLTQPPVAGRRDIPSEDSQSPEQSEDFVQAISQEAGRADPVPVATATGEDEEVVPAAAPSDGEIQLSDSQIEALFAAAPESSSSSAQSAAPEENTVSADAGTPDQRMPARGDLAQQETGSVVAAGPAPSERGTERSDLLSHPETAGQSLARPRPESRTIATSGETSLRQAPQTAAPPDRPVTDQDAAPTAVSPHEDSVDRAVSASGADARLSSRSHVTVPNGSAPRLSPSDAGSAIAVNGEETNLSSETDTIVSGRNPSGRASDPVLSQAQLGTAAVGIAASTATDRQTTSRKPTRDPAVPPSALLDSPLPAGPDVQAKPAADGGPDKALPSLAFSAKGRIASGPPQSVLPADQVAAAVTVTPMPTSAATLALPSGAPVSAERMVFHQITAAVPPGTPAGRIEVMLDPPELGRVEIAIEIADQSLRATVTAERQVTGELIRRHLDQLGAQFREAGFSDVDLSYSGQRGGGRGAGGKGDPADQILAERPATVQPRRPAAQLPGSGRIDIRL